MKKYVKSATNTKLPIPKLPPYDVFGILDILGFRCYSTDTGDIYLAIKGNDIVEAVDFSSLGVFSIYKDASKDADKFIPLDPEDYENDDDYFSALDQQEKFISSYKDTFTLYPEEAYDIIKQLFCE